MMPGAPVPEGKTAYVLCSTAALKARRHALSSQPEAAGLPSGTLYPMLARLQDQGLVTSEWEPQPDDSSGRPPRKYYRLTGEGVRVARLELAQVSVAGRQISHGRARPAPGSAR